MHTTWDDLPEPARRAVTERVGTVRSVAPAGAGATCQFAATLHTDTGPVFCKGIPTGHRLSWTLRNELRVNPHLPGIAPAVRWHVDTAGWLLVGFEHLSGRHADLRPDSPDLPAVAAMLSDLAAAPPPSFPVRPFAARWQGLIAPSNIAGRTLAHTDMSRRNWLIHNGGARLVDWAAPAAGPAWLDTAFTIVRLIRYGHTPADAEQWATRIPAWQTAPDAAVTAFADTLARMWQNQQDRAPAAHRPALITAAQAWCRYRTGRAVELVGA